MEAAFVWWTCACSIKVKAGLDMSKASVTVQCANRPCTTKRTLPGQITQLWVGIGSDPEMWRSVGVDWLIYPSLKKLRRRRSSLEGGVDNANTSLNDLKHSVALQRPQIAKLNVRSTAINRRIEKLLTSHSD